MVGCGGKRDDEGSDTGGITATITATGMSETGDSVGDTNDDGPDKFDIGGDEEGETAGDCDGQGTGGMENDEYEFITLWVANSPEDTVSKIDTQMVQEVARYKAGPAGADPSRTSVNLNGDMVVVNRGGSITKINGRSDLCPEDNNGQAGLQTSTGPQDVLAWGSDDCVEWFVDLPVGPSGTGNPNGPRPVAWEAGELDAGTCFYDPRVWVGWYTGAQQGVFRRMDGKTGATLDELTIPFASGTQWGPYGGAINQDGDFWVVGHADGPLVKIHEDGVNYDTYVVPNAQSQWTYGMALDEYGRPWVATTNGALMFDPGTQQWSTFQLGGFSVRGMGADREGRVWAVLNSGCGLGVIDYNQQNVIAPMLNVPGCLTPVGVSVDHEGFVWMIDQAASTAFKINGDTFQVVGSVTGLNQPYTYSDMTGAGLGIVTNPPQG